MTDSRATPEPASIRSRSRLGLGCAVLFALILVGLVAAGLIWGPQLVERIAGPAAAPALPFEDRTAPAHAAEVRAQAEQRLNSYGWVDEAGGIVHIPITTAMQLVAATPLPVGAPTPAAAADAPADNAEAEADAAPIDLSHVTYQADVLPIFQQYCEECHGAEDPEENLELTRYRTALVGSQNGPVIEPGDPDNSYLVKQIVEGKMPKDADPLPQREIDVIIAWIEAGAPEQ
jgi:hypothetical protein